MDPETEKIIKEQVDKLPIEVRKLLADPELNNKIINIGKRGGLNEEQIRMLQTETYLVMLGLVHPDEYPDELKNRLNIDNFKIGNIVNDVKKEILSGILEKLKEIYGKQKADEEWKQNLNFVFPKWDYSELIENKDDVITSKIK